MLRLTGRQRQALGTTVRELANYGAAALVFGQFVGQERSRGVWRSRAWRSGSFSSPGHLRSREIIMENALLMLGGIAVVVWVIIGLDWWDRRKERQARDRAA